MCEYRRYLCVRVDPDNRPAPLEPLTSFARQDKAIVACLSIASGHIKLQSKRLDRCGDLIIVRKQPSHAADTNERHTRATQARCCRWRHAHSCDLPRAQEHVGTTLATPSKRGRSPATCSGVLAFGSEACVSACACTVRERGHAFGRRSRTHLDGLRSFLLHPPRVRCRGQLQLKDGGLMIRARPRTRSVSEAHMRQSAHAADGGCKACERPAIAQQ